MLETTYLIIALSRCPNCEGAGWIYNKAWESFTAECNRATKLEDMPDGKVFEREHGPEELACSKCGGSGQWRREVELKEALAAIRAEEVEPVHP